MDRDFLLVTEASGYLEFLATPEPHRGADVEWVEGRRAD
jgi:hypothetical protein